MVHFGGHLKAVSDGEKGSHLFLVPYNELKDVIHQHDSEKFIKEWNAALNAASLDFQTALSQVWATIFAALAPPHQDPDLIRGAAPGTALRLYVDTNNRQAALDLLTRLTQIHTAVITNAEALRKIVKKFDKQNTPPVLLSTQPIDKRIECPLRTETNWERETC